MFRGVLLPLLATCIYLHALPEARAWGAVAHAVIGHLAEELLLQDTPAWRQLLARFQDPRQAARVREALRGLDFPEPGSVLRLLANWPDWHKREPGMLAADDQRHYVNLPFTARYNRRQHCADGHCSVETLLAQRAILANQHASLPQRAVALAWIAHLVGDIHQPLHAGQADDRGGNLTCVTWMGEPSHLVSIDGRPRCTHDNLHLVWDSQLIEAATGFAHHNEALAFAQLLRPVLGQIQMTEPRLTARNAAVWRWQIESWHRETQTLILRQAIYPADGLVGPAYVQQHYPVARTQLLRAAVRLAAVLRQSLQP